MIRTLIVGHWYLQQEGDKTLMAIRCQDCKNLMRTTPGKVVVCGRDGRTYNAPETFRGLKPLITRKDLSEKRRQKLFDLSEKRQQTTFSQTFRKWQNEQGFGVTERKWKERMREIEKESKAQ